MRILITGGAGYMGSVTAGLLLEQGHQVEIFDNFTFGVRPILHIATNKNLTIVEGDVRDEAAVGNVVSKADAVLHMAAIVGYPACSADEAKAKAINLDGSRNVIKALSKNQQVVFASTGSTYGKTDGVCDENTPIAPLSLYGSTKAEAEKDFLEFGATALRFATVFGVSPRLRLDLLVNDFVYQALHARQIVLFEGHFGRTFINVHDAAFSWLFALQNYKKMQGESYNIGGDSMNFTKREIAKLIQQKTPYYLHEADVGEDLDKRDYEVSYDKIEALGYRVKVSMDKGLDQLIKVLKHIHVKNEWRNA